MRGARATSGKMFCVHLGTSVIVACCFATISPRGWPPSICRLARRAQSQSRREVTDLPDAMNFAAPVKLFINTSSSPITFCALGPITNVHTKHDTFVYLFSGMGTLQ